MFEMMLMAELDPADFDTRASGHEVLQYLPHNHVLSRALSQSLSYALTHTHTHTHTHRQTDRQTDTHTRTHAHTPCRRLQASPPPVHHRIASVNGTGKS